jgi:hypothetical protein
MVSQIDQTYEDLMKIIKRDIPIIRKRNEAHPLLGFWNEGDINFDGLYKKYGVANGATEEKIRQGRALAHYANDLSNALRD